MLKTLPPIVSVNSKTFVIDSCDEVVGSVLKEHGWKQIPINSISWNLKWTWKADSKSFQALQNGQLINHFQGSDEISTKLGLSLLYKRNPIILDSGKSFLTFFPRSFNLSTQKQEFIADFIQTGILNLLKKIVVCLEVYHPNLFMESVRIKQKHKGTDTSKLFQQLFNSQQLPVKKSSFCNDFKINGKLTIRLLFYMQNIFSLQQCYQFKKEELIELMEYGKQQIPFARSLDQISPSPNLLGLLLIYHEKCMKTMTSFYQDGFSNIWVVKSNHSSRGRNIVLVDSLEDVEAMDNGMKLIQKYVENIWVLHQMSIETRQKYPEMIKLIKKKFDIRFWVLVKSFSPLTVYIYDEAYLRISSESYQLNALNQKQSHLTNYSINWKRKEKTQSYLLFSQFLKFVLENEQIDPKSIRQKIDNIILQTLKLVQIKKDQRCFQLFGFDVILDAKLNPWILQCNMSPACAPRGELKDLVRSMTIGMLSILGLIKNGVNGWRSLFDGKQSQRYIQEAASCRVFKQTCQNFTTRCSIMRMKTSTNHSNQILLFAKKLEWKKYKIIERAHYYMEKVQLIQRFFRSKLRRQERKENSHLKMKNANRCLKLLQVLARISKQLKKQYFDNMKLKEKPKVKNRNKFRITF